jgi:hypothetical protein
LKPTVEPQRWAHVACALYTNETFFVDPDAMEPIDGIAAVEARVEKRQYRCGLCGVKKGTCSTCCVKGCGAPFHISCGVSQGASFEVSSVFCKAFLYPFSLLFLDCPIDKVDTVLYFVW